jgi:hypothetical protein
MPTTGLCSSGTTSTVTDTGAGSWVWDCTTSGGTNTACYALQGTGTCKTGTTPNGNFQDFGGEIVDPNGNQFIARGVAVMDTAMSSASTGPSGAPLTTLFPGINFVRLAAYSYNPPSYYQTFINQMTALGIVVEIEDHTSSDGLDTGGGTGVIYTGSLLTNESNWYAALATAFANNPYVWFGTDNEPSAIDADGNRDEAALSTWQQQTYQAIRGAGNNNIIMVESNCYDGNPGVDCNVGYTPSVYAGMTNIVWDDHFYGWIVPGNSADQATVDQTLAQEAASSQQTTSADGTVPVLIGEYGDSTTGTSLDPNGTQVVTAVASSGFGSAAWAFAAFQYDGLIDGNGGLTAYGQQVAQYIATGATGAPNPGAPAATPGTASTSTGAGSCH